MEAALQVTDLTKTYPGFKLDHVSFTLPQGAVMGLIGENGAGKSTTIKAILDLIRKDDGTVTFWGRKLSDSKQLKEDIGVVFEQGNFYETLTSTQIGSISAAAYTQWDQKVYEGYLERFQLPKDKALKTLSNGMRTKLGIAVALSHHPKLLILDEATSGLDPVSRDELTELLGRIAADGQRSVLFSTHITSDLEKCASHISFIKDGQIQYTGTLEDFRAHYAYLRRGDAPLTLEDIIVSVERRPLDENAII